MEKSAFIFPGQGAQFSGMGKDLYSELVVRCVFEEAGDLLKRNLAKEIFEGTNEDLKKTVLSQLGIYTLSWALVKLLEERYPEITPSFVAGLSLGEITAYTYAEVFSFAEGVLLVKERAELMEKACKKFPGSMCALIGISKEDVQNLLEKEEKIGIANINCSGQIVVSGDVEALKKFKEKALNNGAKKAIFLDVQGAFHSPLMEEAEKGLENFLKTKSFSSPRIPCFSNVSGQIVEKEKIKEWMPKQITSPVLWEEIQKNLSSQGVIKVYEVGPSKVLQGFWKRTCPHIPVQSLGTAEDLQMLESRTVVFR